MTDETPCLDALVRFDTGPLRVRVTVAPLLAQALADALDGYCQAAPSRGAPTPASAAAPTHEVDLSIGLRRDSGAGLPRLPRFERRAAAWVDRSELWDADITWSGSSMVARFLLRDTRHYDAGVRARWEAHFQRMWLGAVLRTTLALAAPRADALLLHAAAVEAPSGGAFVFAGPSEEGKTTMTRRLPWPALADDAVLVFRAPGGWRVAGTPIAGREHLPRRAASAPLAGLAFLAKNAAVPSLVRLEAGEGLAALLSRILYFAEPDERLLTVAYDLALSGRVYRLSSSLQHDVAPLLPGADVMPC